MIRFRPLRDLAFRRWRLAWPGVLQAAGAAGVAWVLAQWIMGSTHPVFAPIAALACLSPGVARRARQALLMTLGAATGVVVGLALLLVIPPTTPGIVTIVALTMMAAATFDISAVTLIQAGASAILVATSGQPGIGAERVGDAAIGAAIGLLVSQVLFTPDPVARIRTEARGLLREAAAGLGGAAAALRSGDGAAMAGALTRFHATNQRLMGLLDAVDSARAMRRWTVRGRLVAAAVEREIERHDHLATQIGAGMLLLGEALRDRMGDPAPPPLLKRLDWLAGRAASLGEGRDEVPPWPGDGPEDAPAPAAWAGCDALIRAMRERLDRLAPRLVGPDRPAG